MQRTIEVVELTDTTVVFTVSVSDGERIRSRHTYHIAKLAHRPRPSQVRLTT
jgi:hypothetical protein